MKAVEIGKYGQVDEVVEVVDEAGGPTVGAGQVLIEVHAASLNPADAKLAEGMFHNPEKPLGFPARLGSDVAGVVTALGSDVTDLKVGDHVYGSAGIMSGGSGSFAEVATADAKRIAIAPKNLDHTQAASLPLVGISAFMALVESIKLAAGQKVLIHGGAGGIGSIAIQLAKHLGTHVVTTVKSTDVEFAKELGADEVIAYDREQFDDKVSDCDAVFDTVGGETYERSFKVLKKGGVLVSMLEQPNEALMQQFGVTAISQFTKITRERLDQLTKFVNSGAIRPIVAKIFPLDETHDAFKSLAAHPRGKVVLKIHE